MIPLDTPLTAEQVAVIEARKWRKNRLLNSEQTPNVLDYSGGGKISVSVADIVNSPRVQKQVAAVRRILVDA